jgi:hypothetical protein
MPVRTTTSCPAPAAGDDTGADARLPWWGLVLPVLAFVTLLLLVAEPAGGTGPGSAEVFSRLAEIAGR